MAHTMPVRVRFYELDPYNHVNHSVYVSYFETARVELLTEAGYGLGAMRRDGLTILVSEIHAKFVKAAGEGDELIVETEILDFRRVTSHWRQRITRDGELIAVQDLRAAMVTVDGKPVRFSDGFLEAMQPYMASDQHSAGTGNALRSLRGLQVD